MGNTDSDLSTPSKEDGFTLLELLVALAILSMISLATFQSITLFTGLSARSDASAMRVLDKVSERASLASLATGLLPGWAGEADFQGDSEGFSAQASVELADAPEFKGVVPIEVTLDRDGLWLRGPERADPIRLGRGAAEGGFLYLGTDGQWRRTWPPETPVAFYSNIEMLQASSERDARVGFQGAQRRSIPNDDHLLTGEPPHLPIAIRLDRDDGTSTVMAVPNAGPPPADSTLGMGL